MLLLVVIMFPNLTQDQDDPKQETESLNLKLKPPNPINPLTP